ncbi:MAG: DUF3566 domain-containing protein [Acidimicrobiia bacterium]
MSKTIEPEQPEVEAVKKVTRRQRKQEAMARDSNTTRQMIKKFDLWSVLKVSLCFHLCGMFTTLVAFVALWLLADALGAINKVNDFVGQLISTSNFRLVTGELIFGLLLIGLVLVALFTIVTTLAAAFYNLFADVVGGVEIVVVDDDASAE